MSASFFFSVLHKGPAGWLVKGLPAALQGRGGGRCVLEGQETQG